MKYFSIYLTALVLLLIAVCCDDQSEPIEMGKLSISMSQISRNSGRIEGTDNIKEIVVTIKNELGSKYFDQKKISVLGANGQYFSQDIELPVGNYTIEEFFAIDTNNKMVAITPKQNSPLASLISHPLPNPFEVNRTATTEVSIEVIGVESIPPSEFGYNANILLDVKPVTAFYINMATAGIDHIEYQLLRVGETITGGGNFSNAMVNFDNANMIGHTYDMNIKLVMQANGGFTKTYFYKKAITFNGNAIELPFVTMAPWESYYLKNLPDYDLYFPVDPRPKFKMLIQPKFGAMVAGGLVQRSFTKGGGTPLGSGPCNVSSQSIIPAGPSFSVEFPDVCTTTELNYNISANASIQLQGQQIPLSSFFQWKVQNNVISPL